MLTSGNSSFHFKDDMLRLKAEEGLSVCPKRPFQEIYSSWRPHSSESVTRSQYHAHQSGYSSKWLRHVDLAMGVHRNSGICNPGMVLVCLSTAGRPGSHSCLARHILDALRLSLFALLLRALEHLCKGHTSDCP